MKLTIGVTGHRDLLESELPALRQQVRAFLVDLDEAYPGLDLQLISPLAEGSDQLVAEVAVDLGIPLVVPLPMSQREYEKDFLERAGLEKFRELMKRAEIVRLPVATREGGQSETDQGLDREEQYMQLGVFISNHCQVLLALWDGKSSEEFGGTAGVVNYHLTAVMPGYSIAEDSPNLLADNENDLAYHIVVSRDRPDGAPADKLQPGDAFWISAHFERREGIKLPSEFHTMLLRLQDYNEDYLKYETEIEREAQGLFGDAPDLPRPEGAEFVNCLFARTDWLAIHFQKRFNQGMLFTHGLAVVMGLVFLVYAEYGGPEVLLYLILLLFFSGVALYTVGSKRQWHRKYLDYRALAEGLRVQFYWNLGGVVETRSAVFAYDNFLQKQDVDLGWIRHVMRSASLRRDRLYPPHDGWVSWVCERWVGTSDSDSGQLSYYLRKGRIKTDNYRRTTRLGSLSLWGGIFIAMLLAAAAGRISDEQRHLLLVCMGVLPLIAGIRDTYSHKKAERELIKQYRFMSRVFENAQRLLKGNADIAFRRRVLMAVGNAALEEHAEWILMHRERPLEHGGL
ncbi:MAG: hypothetical protein HKN15_08495 [Xanthomonadales bacterium]|nr:hypothetical protein [Xanthomonadales bacterium]